jgi:hypothetical protein
MNRIFLILLGVMVAGNAHATPFQGNEIYRTGDRRGTFIVVTGQPNTAVDVTGPLSNVSATVRRADSCGVARIRLGEGTPKLEIDGRGEINWRSLPTISSYSCEGLFPTIGQNSYNPTNQTVYLTGFEFQQEYIARIRRPAVRSARINNCGFGLLSMPTGDGNLTFKGQNYTYSQLANTVRPPVCREINGTYKTYFAIPLGQ